MSSLNALKITKDSLEYNTDEKHGYIYLVRTREFKSLGRHIYKVGKTSQCPDTRITRLHKYTKGSEIYLILQCHINDVSLIEKEILEQFCHRWDPGQMAQKILLS